MRLAVDAVLAERARRVRAGTRASVFGSLMVHVVIVAAFAVAPLLAATRKQEVPEFVPVYVVPAQALGVPEPTPARRPAPPAPEQPEPEPETPVPDKPEPEPAPTAEPVLPSPEPRRRKPAAQPPRQAAPESGGELGRRQGSPTGTSTGTAAFGGASLSFADQNFTYGYYIDQMLAMIHAQWARPALGGEVEAAVFFRIRRDGAISDLRIVDSSGFNVFDLAGLRAVQQAAPFPRLPVSYPQSSLAVKLILR